MNFKICTMIFFLQLLSIVISKTTFKPNTEKNRFYRLIFNNLYNEDIKKNRAEQKDDMILNDISTWFGLSSNSFDSLKLLSNNEGRTVVEFRLKSGVHYTINEMHKLFENKTGNNNFKLPLSNIDLQPLVKLCYWEEGQNLYDTSCAKLLATTPETNYNLLALLVIPIIIIIAIIVIAFLWFLKYKPRNKTNVTLNEMGYVQNVSKVGGTVSSKNNGGLSMANSTVRNEVYTTMGKSFGFSIDNADFSNENVDDTN